MSIHHSSAVWVLGLGVIAGCGASLQPGDVIVFPIAPPSEDGCAPALARVSSVDEATPLGFTAVDVLARLSGPRSSALDWLEAASSEEYLIEYGPERGRSTLDLDVRLADGPILHRYRTPVLGAPEGTECDAGALEIPVEVTLRSAGQALDERFEATLEARVPYRARLTKTFAPGSLAGGLELDKVRSLDPARTFELGALTLDAVLWPGGSMGSLAARVDAHHATPARELRPPPDPAEQPRSIATWPSGRDCPGEEKALPIDAPVLGFSAADVLERLARGGPRQLALVGGTSTPVHVELAQVVDTELCQDVTDSLRFAVKLRAKSEDGSVDEVLQVRVQASDEGGDVGEITLATDDPDAAQLAQPAAQLGASPEPPEEPEEDPGATLDAVE
jgi:hypothetical protein